MVKIPELRVPVGRNSYGVQVYARAEIKQRRRGGRVIVILRWWTTNGVRTVAISKAA